MNKFDTNELMNCFKMTVDLTGIKKLEEYIRNLEQENQQLKEQKKELRSWLEDELLRSDIYVDEYVIAIKNTLSKLNELEGGRNENI